MKFKLYHLPGACSRVTMTALEHVGADYDDEVVDLKSGAHKTPEYLAINPHAKVPALVIDGEEVLTENASILLYLHKKFPEKGLFPETTSDLDAARQISDLFWVSATWHPSVRANYMPIRWTTREVEGVQERGRELARKQLETLEKRLGDQSYLYGDEPAITDVYINWCCHVLDMAKFDFAPYKTVVAWRERVAAFPAHQAALAREKVAAERAASAN